MTNPMTFNTLLKQLSRKGYRKSELREKILYILVQLKAPITVPNLMRQLTKHQLIVHKTSVYRELETLLKEDFIVENDFHDGFKYYEIAREHHHHLICQICHTSECVDMDETWLHESERSMSIEKGFKITNHSIEFFGICHKCR